MEEPSGDAEKNSNQVQQPPVAAPTDQGSAKVKSDKKKESKKQRKEKKKKSSKRKVSELTPKEIEKIKIVHTETIAALKACSSDKLSEEDKKVIASLEKLKRQLADGKSVSTNLLKIAKDLFLEKERQARAAKEQEVKRKRE